MFYNADGVTNGPVKTVPAFMMDVLARLPKIKAQGKSDVLKFSKFTLPQRLRGRHRGPRSQLPATTSPRRATRP